jgi:hypothetical protein
MLGRTGWVSPHVIINNDGTADPVTGTFNGLPEGATILNFLGSPLKATITYTGGDGNDVVLTAAAPVPGNLQFSAANYDDPEQNSLTHTAIITVQRVGGIDGAVSVHWATSADTATPGSDYTEGTGDLNWAAGDVADKTFTVTVSGDTTVEADETVNLTLSAPTGGAGLGTPNPATLTIKNDDACPTITLSPATLPDEAIGNAYSTNITADGGVSPYTFAAAGSVPTGLTLNSDGTWSGTATALGTFSFAVGSLSGAAGIGGGAIGASLAAASLSAGRPIKGEPGGRGAAGCWATAPNVNAPKKAPASNRLRGADE